MRSGFRIIRCVNAGGALDPCDFHEINRAYAEFFTQNQPTRSILRIDFMFDCRIEIKVTAYKPIAARKTRR